MYEKHLANKWTFDELYFFVIIIFFIIIIYRY